MQRGQVRDAELLGSRSSSVPHQQLWGGHLTALSLSFLVCKMGSHDLPHRDVNAENGMLITELASGAHFLLLTVISLPSVPS